MNAIQLLEKLLRAEIGITKASQCQFEYPSKILDQVVDSNRLILLKEGVIDYTVESTTCSVASPAMLFVPAWTRRFWELKIGQSCLMAWCEFTASIFEPTLHGLFIKRQAEWKHEEACLARMASIWKESKKQTLPGSRPAQLLVEGELKAALARFFATGTLLGTHKSDSAAHTHVPREVEDALAWLENNFRLDDAAALLKRRLTYAEGSFRRQFKRHTGFTPTEYLRTLRMRYARYLLDSTSLSVKETSAAIGFRDPLWFSKQYHAFWGYPPSQERAPGQDA